MEEFHTEQEFPPVLARPGIGDVSSSEPEPDDCLVDDRRQLPSLHKGDAHLQLPRGPPSNNRHTGDSGSPSVSTSTSNDRTQSTKLHGDQLISSRIPYSRRRNKAVGTWWKFLAVPGPSRDSTRRRECGNKVQKRLGVGSRLHFLLPNNDLDELFLKIPRLFLSRPRN